MVFFPKLSNYIDRETFETKMEPTLINMIMDPVFTIREESTNSVIKLAKTIHD